MADKSQIEWTEATWNPIAGCSVVSPGCTNCYAMRRVAPRLSANPATPHYAGTVQPSKAGPVWTGKIGIAADSVLLKPLTWRRPRMIFVNSTSDLFHESVPDEVIDRIFAVMALCPQHTFQVLTKRAKRMREYLAQRSSAVSPTGFRCPRINHILNVADRLSRTAFPRAFADLYRRASGIVRAGCFPNVWLGVSVEDQTRAEERIPDLLATPAAVRFISAEPLLGPIDLTTLCPGWYFVDALKGLKYHDAPDDTPSATESCARLDWVIVGGESGDGARPMHPDWARNLRDQCAAAGVPFFFKQWGEWKDGSDFMPDAHVVLNDGRHRESSQQALRDLDRESSVMAANPTLMRRVGKHAAGRLLDGVEHNGMPGATPP